MSGPLPSSDQSSGAQSATSLLAAQRLFASILNSMRHSSASRLGVMLARADFSGRRELAGLRPVTRLLIVGLTSWIGVVALTTVIAVVSVEMSTMSFPGWLDTRASASPGIEHRLNAGFEDILQRPLFSRSRQAASAVVSMPSSQPPLPPLVIPDQNFILKGVYINGGLAKAFMTSAQNPIGVWVQTNEEIAGWRVVAVKPNQVLLDARNEKLVVQLSVNGSAK
jgi:hypothetical protein